MTRERALFSKRMGDFVAIFFGILLTVNLLLLAELYFTKAMRSKPQVHNGYSQVYSEIDPYIGDVLRPDLNQVKDVQIRNGVIQWDIEFSTDLFGRRVTTGSDEKHELFISFFGCSFIFGTGLNDNQTLTSEFARQQSIFTTYNYGVPGYGIHQILAKFESQSLGNEIPEKNGIMIYNFIPDHFYRIFGKRNLTAPRYVVEGSKVVYKGLFTDSWRAPLYRAASQIQLFRYFDVEFTILRQSDFDLFCKILIETERSFKKQYPSGEFYTLIYEDSRDMKSEVVKCLKQNQIAYLDFSQQSREEWMRIPHDGHPSAEGNKKLAQWLMPELRKVSQLLRR